jgi:hypothetical protein
MVKGLDKFKDFFKEFSKNYLLIGGAACDRQLENAGLEFRATEDLDIVLIVEAYSTEFVKKFWEFIEEGKYEIKEKSTGKKIYYRFKKPSDDSFPWQLELFARKPEITLSEDARLTPIPVGEDATSLSAILLNDEYYDFTIKNSEVIEDIPIASTGALICLKAGAHLDLKKRKKNGEKVDDKDIKKHRDDIIRLAAILADENIEDLPQQLKDDLIEVISDFKKENPDVSSIGKSLGIPDLNITDIIKQLEKTFSL